MPPVIEDDKEAITLGVVPLKLIVMLKMDSEELDWKDREHAAEELLFLVETLPEYQTAKLVLFADSFIQFIEEFLLPDPTLKVVRIGLRLLRFLLVFGKSLAERTNLGQLASVLMEMLNDPKGVLRAEVQHLFIHLARVMNFKHLM